MTPDPAAVPDGWQVMRLGDVATLQRGMDLPEDKRIFGRVPVFGSNGVHGFHNASPVQGPGVITGRSGSMGHVYYSESSYWPLNTTLFVKDFHGNDERFVFHLLSNSRLERFAASTGVPSLNRNFVHPLRVALPPLAEQRAIAAVLDAIDEAIERTEEVIAATERLRDALLHELLTRGLPGRHSAWADVPGLGTVPACWDVVRLGDVGRWLSGGTPSKARPDYWSGTLPWVSPKDMKAREIRGAQDHITEEAARTGSRVVPPDTIFVVVRGMILAHSFPLAVARIAAAFNQDMKALICRDGLLPDFVLAGMEQQKPRLLQLPTPSTHGTMRVVSEELFALQVPVPPLEEQQAIAAVLDGVDGAIERARDERTRLHSLQASAADALLTGRVRVADATGEAT